MAEESTENSTSSEQQQSNENITIPPISKPAAGAAAGAVLGGVGGPVGAVVGGVIGAIAGKAAATGEPIGATAKKAIGLRSARRSRSKPKAKGPTSQGKKSCAPRKRTKNSRLASVETQRQ